MSGSKADRAGRRGLLEYLARMRDSALIDISEILPPTPAAPAPPTTPLSCTVDESGGMEELTRAEEYLTGWYGPGRWVTDSTPTPRESADA